MKIKTVDETGKTLELSYEVTECGGFYGVGVTLDGTEHAGATFLRNESDARALRDMLCRAEVTPSTFYDVLGDYLSGLR